MEGVWFGVIGFVLTVYAVLDGFDRGWACSIPWWRAPSRSAAPPWRRWARCGTAARSG